MILISAKYRKMQSKLQLNITKNYLSSKQQNALYSRKTRPARCRRFLF